MLAPGEVAKWTHMSKNKVYALIEGNNLLHYKYIGGYLISKADMIEYLAETTSNPPTLEDNFIGRKNKEKH